MEKELEASKCVARNFHGDIEALRSELEQVKGELVQVKSEALARDSAETERNLSAEVSLRQQIQLELETSSRLFEEEKHALTLRCQELMHTLTAIDNEKSKYSIYFLNTIVR